MIATANPFVNQQLKVPDIYQEDLKRFTGTFRDEAGQARGVDKAPFRRYVDLWWSALCIGVQEGRQEEPVNWHPFITGAVLNENPWRIRQLQLLALSVGGDSSILKDSGQIIGIANGFAATGLPILIDKMTRGTLPVWGASELLVERATKNAED